ncbi:25184_t:CDS:2, partial [Racocetra persica]
MKEVFGLDPLNYITLASFVFDIAKKMTKTIHYLKNFLQINEYVFPMVHSYALKTEDEYKNIQKAKGLKKSLIKKELTIDIYEHCILEGVEDEPKLQTSCDAIGNCRIPAYLSALEQYGNNISQEILIDL